MYEALKFHKLISPMFERIFDKRHYHYQDFFFVFLSNRDLKVLSAWVKRLSEKE